MVSEKKSFLQGELLIREGEWGTCAYIIESGSVEIVLQRDGQMIQIGTRGAGSVIGEMALIDDKPRTATVRALEDCEVLEISREDFSHRLESADPILQMFMRVIMTRYRDVIGRTNFLQVFTPSEGTAENTENCDKMHDVAVKSIKVHNELKHALDNDELVLFYQPIIDMKHVRIAGFEALMRWKHPEKGMISPGVFIPVAEDSGLIVEMTRWALRTSCDALKLFQQSVDPALLGPHPLFLSVNFSVKDFMQNDFFDHLQATLTEKETDPALIHVEITESLMMEAPGSARDALDQCRQNGMSISIDDFGTGYSSLGYLHHFPIDTLKIDQSFVRSMNQKASSLMLVKSIIGLARNLNMKVIAEGIETEREASILRALGCEECQGYWFSKPLCFDDAIQFLQNWKPPVII